MTVKNLEMLLSDKLNQYVVDILKNRSKMPQMKPSQNVTLEKQNFGHEEGQQGSGKNGSLSKKAILIATEQKSTVLREKVTGHIYEKLLKDGKSSNGPKKEKLLAILDEIESLKKQQVKTEAQAKVQVQTMPIEQKEIEEREALDLSEGDLIEEEFEEDFEEESEEDFEEEDPSSSSDDDYDAAGEDDGTISLKECYKNVYLKT